MTDTVQTSGPPVPGVDAPTLSELLTAGTAMLAQAMTALAACQAAAVSAAASATAAADVPALTTVIGAPVTSVFGRLAAVVAQVNDYSFSQISGSVSASQMPALSGAIMTSAGSTVTSFSTIPNDTAAAGDFLFTNIVAPGTPSSGLTRLYIDSTAKVPQAKNDAGVVSTMIVPANPGGGVFVTGFNSAGVMQTATPGAGAFSGITGVATVAQMPADVLTSELLFVISGNGSTIGTGLQGWLQCSFPCTINSVTLLGDQSGSITIDIWKCTYSQYAPGTHPVVGDSICASDVPNINSASKNTDSTLTGWTKTISAGDILAFNVKIASVNITLVTVSLSVTKT